MPINKKVIIDRLRSIKREGINEVIEYLEKAGYFKAPASTKFHSNFWGTEDTIGGLAYHSHIVTEILIKKNEEYSLGLDVESIYIMGYLHDVCKIGAYGVEIGGNIEKYEYKPMKDPLTNRWVAKKIIQFNTKNPKLLLGHGELSAMRVGWAIKNITDEEMLAIRWHMGPYEGKEKINDFHKACSAYKSVMALFLADLEASHLVESIIEPEVVTIEEKNAYDKRVAEGKVI